MKKSFAVADYLKGSDIKETRERLGMTQAAFAEMINVSKKTIERWETSDNEITGPIVLMSKILREYPEIKEELEIPDKKTPLRLWYMYKQHICAVIDVDQINQKVKVTNFTHNLIERPFGNIEKPTFAQYEEFLESRCFPRTRDKMKLALQELNIPFYEPLLIIEKTSGRMAEDEFWIRIER